MLLIEEARAKPGEPGGAGGPGATAARDKSK